MATPYAFPVDLTSIMLFASALGETNRIYHDEDYASRTPLGGVIAPPTFPIAAAHWNPSYPLRGVRRIPEAAAPPTFAIASAHWDPNYSLRGVRQVPPSAARLQRAEESGRAVASEGGGGLSRALHGEQRFEYHQPVRPGMRLSVSTRRGRSWEKEGRRGGSLRFSETITEYRDERGQPVVTATSVGVITSKVVEI